MDINIHEIKMKFESTFCSDNGLTIPEIAVLYCAPSFSTETNSFSTMWLYKYGIENMHNMLSSLVERSFLTTGSAVDALKTSSIVEVRKIVDKFGLKRTRKRDDMIAQILQNLSRSEIEQVISAKPYIHTELGLKELEHNQYVIYFHNNKIDYSPQINVAWMNRMLHDHPDYKSHWRDLIWSKLNEETISAMEEANKGNCGLYVLNRVVMSKFLLEENKYLDALQLLTEGVYWQLNKRTPENYRRALKSYGHSNENLVDAQLTTYIYSDIFSNIQSGLGLSYESFAMKIRETACFPRFAHEYISIGLISAWVLAEVMQNTEQRDFIREKYIDAITKSTSNL